MILNKQQFDELLEVSLPLMEWLSNNCHPHCECRVDSTDVTLVEGIAHQKTLKFLND